MINLHTKFEVLSFNGSEDRTGAQNLKRPRYVRPFQGYFIILRLGLSMVDQSSKFEVSIATRYEDRKGDTQ